MLPYYLVICTLTGVRHGHFCYAPSPAKAYAHAVARFVNHFDVIPTLESVVDVTGKSIVEITEIYEQQITLSGHESLA